MATRAKSRGIVSFAFQMREEINGGIQIRRMVGGVGVVPISETSSRGARRVQFCAPNEVCAASKFNDAGIVLDCTNRSIEFVDSLRFVAGNSCEPHARLEAMADPA